MQGDLVVARRSLNESLEMEQRLNLRSAMANAVSALGELALYEGDLTAARRLHNQSLQIHTELGEKGRAADSRLELAVLELEAGNSAEAETLAREAAMVFAEQKVRDNEATARATLALALEARNRGAMPCRRWRVPGSSRRIRRARWSGWASQSPAHALMPHAINRPP